MKINVFSEIGKLNSVLLHRPGKELENLTPDLLERLLFDDIPYLKVAQEEHDAFAKTLTDNGIKTGVTLMPILPFINDDEKNLLDLIELAKKYRADHIFAFFGVTLRDRQRAYFYRKLDTYFPGMKQKYQKTFKESYSCHSPNQKKLYEILSLKCSEYHILYKMQDINQSFIKPKKQLSFNI